MDASAETRAIALVGELTAGGTRPFAVLDGGLSTALEELGAATGGLLWTAAAVAEQPDLVTAAHRAAVDAGADVVITASYQASVAGFERAGLSRRAARAALASTTDLARRSGARVVAASVGPFGACRADGSEYHGRYDVGWDEVCQFHRDRLEVLASTAPDLFAVETVPTAVEAEIIVSELRRVSDTPAWASFACASEALTCGGDDLVDAAAAVAAEVELVGVNCTPPQHVGAAIRALSARFGRRLVAYPNAGASWDAQARCWRGVAPPADLAAAAVGWAQAGAVLVGGCCGVGTATVAAIAAASARPAGVAADRARG